MLIRKYYQLDTNQEMRITYKSPINDDNDIDIQKIEMSEDFNSSETKIEDLELHQSNIHFVIAIFNNMDAFKTEKCTWIEIK